MRTTVYIGFGAKIPQGKRAGVVEALRRLIEEPEGRLVKQAAYQGETLLHAGRIRVETLVFVVDPEEFVEIANSRGQAPSAQPVERGKEFQILLSREPGVEPSFRRGDEADRSPYFRVVSSEARAVDKVQFCNG